MSIIDNLLARFAIHDIIGTNKTRVAKLSLNTLLDIESMANFFLIYSNSSFFYLNFKEYEDSIIENNISQLSDDLASRQK